MRDIPTHPNGEVLSDKERIENRKQSIRNLDELQKKRGWHYKPPAGAENNRHILSWWTSDYDELLRGLIRDYGASWHQQLSGFERHLPAKDIAAWRRKDPLCAQYAYYNILGNFAVARARSLGFEDAFNVDEVAECQVCHREFLTSALRANVREVLGTSFCGTCVAKAFWLDGDVSMSRRQMLSYIRDLTDSWKRIPPATINLKDLAGVPVKLQRTLVDVLSFAPADDKVREEFGSWFEALIAADVLEEDAQRMTIGTRCKANDGHVCLSFGEKTIDDLMYSAGIEHTKEPRYPTGKMRADFKVGDTLIEYFGLAGNADYDRKIVAKRQLAADNGIPLIEIYPRDLADQAALLKRLSAAVRGGG